MIPKIMVEVTQYGICKEVWRRAVLRKSHLLKPSTDWYLFLSNPHTWPS